MVLMLVGGRMNSRRRRMVVARLMVMIASGHECHRLGCRARRAIEHVRVVGSSGSMIVMLTGSCSSGRGGRCGCRRTAVQCVAADGVVLVMMVGVIGALVVVMMVVADALGCHHLAGVVDCGRLAWIGDGGSRHSNRRIHGGRRVLLLVLLLVLVVVLMRCVVVLQLLVVVLLLVVLVLLLLLVLMVDCVDSGCCIEACRDAVRRCQVCG